MAVWGKLRPLMVNTDEGWPLKVWGANDQTINPAAEERYTRLL